MDLSSHPSVDELRQAIQARGANVACNVCRQEEFSTEQVAIMEAGSGYGTQRIKRMDLVCQNCGHVMGFELDRLRQSRPE